MYTLFSLEIDVKKFPEKTIIPYLKLLGLVTIVQKIFRMQCFVDIDTIPTISQWYFRQLTSQIQTKRKVSKPSSPNVAVGIFS